MAETGHYHKQTKAVINRLSRIEGHVRSIKAMVEEGRDCADVLVQIAAVRSAVGQVGRVVLEDHVESCLLTAAADGTADEVWVDLQKAFGVFLKS
ncbi:MAG: metal-sensing transcriptional repressor [Anaerolineae bacterium]|nr:metal-sensing transcriptional repressor [Anaerolineae bacterium]